jgi:predicted signal transduction protein with EAL and GGDEF domain
VFFLALLNLDIVNVIAIVVAMFWHITRVDPIPTLSLARLAKPEKHFARTDFLITL